MNNPVLGIFVYHGTSNVNGVPQSVYSLDTSHMKKIGAANLTVGQTAKLPNGVTVTFDGWKPWASCRSRTTPRRAGCCRARSRW